MFSFEKSGAGVTGAGLAAGFCASAWLQLIRRMASKQKRFLSFSWRRFSLKCAHSAPSPIQTPPPLASFIFRDYGLLRKHGEATLPPPSPHPSTPRSSTLVDLSLLAT